MFGAQCRECFGEHGAEDASDGRNVGGTWAERGWNVGEMRKICVGSSSAGPFGLVLSLNLAHCVCFLHDFRGRKRYVANCMFFIAIEGATPLRPRPRRAPK